MPVVTANEGKTRVLNLVRNASGLDWFYSAFKNNVDLSGGDALSLGDFTFAKLTGEVTFQGLNLATPSLIGNNGEVAAPITFATTGAEGGLHWWIGETFPFSVYGYVIHQEGVLVWIEKFSSPVSIINSTTALSRTFKLTIPGSS